MTTRTEFVAYLKYSALAALLYCTAVFFFVRDASFYHAGYLFIGNGLFFFVMIFFMLSYNKQKGENMSSLSLMKAGHVTAITGVVLACLGAFLILIIMVPGLFHRGMAARQLAHAPAQAVNGNTQGMTFEVFMDAILGNISVGSFASIMLSFTAKKDQTKETPSNKSPE